MFEQALVGNPARAFFMAMKIYSLAEKAGMQ